MVVFRQQRFCEHPFGVSTRFQPPSKMNTAIVRFMEPGPARAWIGCNVLDGFVWDWATRELIVMADPRHPRRFTEEFKRQIVQS